MVRDEDVAYHAKGTYAMYPNWLPKLGTDLFSAINAYTIGIELELLKTDPDGAYTDNQYETLAALIHLLRTRHNFVADRAHIIGHYQVQANRTDPRGLNWQRLGI